MKRRNNSSISIIQKRILASKELGRVWTIADFAPLPANTIAQSLYRLSQEGFLTHYARGLYYRQVETILGPSTPNQAEIAKAIARSTGKHVVETGYTGYAAMGFTTQLPGKITLATDKPLRSSILENKRVRHVLRSRNTLANSLERWVLDALRDINKMSGTTPANIIDRVLVLAKRKSIDIEHIAKLALCGEPPNDVRLVSPNSDRSRVAAGLRPDTSALCVFAPFLSFYATRITAPSTGDGNTLLQDLIKDSFMKTWPLLRGEKPRIAAVCV